MQTFAAGLPNITGTFKACEMTNDVDRGAPVVTGALYAVEGNTNLKSNGGNGANSGIGFDASKSSSIYGRSSTVQPPAIVLIPQIKI